ncbi:protein of unknown function [[Clostridium] ultunense Esp]|uniref:Uncharacterized protein n=1 Tax=[Clostridium] ultunense Esp TaxID=1288971 RepID=A0A1M4PPK7_9FIRM|nr:protein of unknown function [[Clostridium] ultunense Esp]
MQKHAIIRFTHPIFNYLITIIYHKLELSSSGIYSSFVTLW